MKWFRTDKHGKVIPTTNTGIYDPVRVVDETKELSLSITAAEAAKIAEDKQQEEIDLRYKAIKRQIIQALKGGSWYGEDRMKQFKFIYVEENLNPQVKEKLLREGYSLEVILSTDLGNGLRSAGYTKLSWEKASN